MARRLGVLERCIWEAATPEILDAYAAADIYISPSREDSFGMPVAEAMACGLPIITSFLAGVASLLNDTVDSFILRDPFDARALASIIVKVYKDIELRGRICEAAAKASLEWTWDRSAGILWQLLQNSALRRN